MEVIIIAAVSKNGIIGKDGTMPWHISEDLKHFKELTTGSPIVMGRVTAQSLGRPLPGRENIVVSGKGFIAKGFQSFESFEEAIEYAKERSATDKVYIIGGGSIYKLGLEIADKMEITEVEEIYDGDTRFPDVDWSKWEEIDRETHEGYSFVSYKRKPE